MTSPAVGKVSRLNGPAGQIVCTVTVTYPDEEPRVVSFSGSSYGGPVVMITDAGQTFVTDPGRFGEFGTEWVRRFFGEG